MKAFIPYIVLGIIGAAGAVFGTSAVARHGTTPPPAHDGPVKVRVALDRTTLPAAGGSVFARVALEGVLDATQQAQRVPVSVTLVIDRSGSMAGAKMEDAKRAAVRAVQSLRKDDQVCAVSFDNGAEQLGCATIGTGNEANVIRGVEALFARGGTDMAAGLQVGGVAAGTIFGADRVNRVLLLSDGRPNTEAGLRETVRGLAQRGITTTTLGLGADYNEDLMSGLADAGLGRYHFIDNPEKLAGIFNAELDSLASVVARAAVIELSPADGVVIDEVVGFVSERSDGRLIVSAGDVYGGKTTDVLVRMTVAAGSGSDKDVLRAKVDYTVAKDNTRLSTTERLAAAFSTDDKAVLASVVPDVMVKAEQWRASQAWNEANEAFNRNDFAGGNAIMQRAQERLRDQAASAPAAAAAALGAELKEMAEYQRDNEARGAAGRSAMSKAAKKKAWAMNKGDAY